MSVEPHVPAGLVNNPTLASWISFDRPGVVTLRSGKVEIGQGIGTALAQIAADELDIPVDAVEIISGDTASCPNEGWTSASISVQEGGSAIRALCAHVRQLFLAAAARKARVAVDDLTIAKGTFCPRGASSDVSYWTLAPLIDLHQPYEPGSPVKPRSTFRYVGESIKRRDLDGILRGSTFIHDLDIPNMWHGRVIRPPNLSCRLLEVAVDRIKELPGVRAVVIDGSFVAVCSDREEYAIAAALKAQASVKWSRGVELPPPHSVGARLRSLPYEERVLVQDSEEIRGDYEVKRASYSKPFIAHASIGLCCAIAAASSESLVVWSQSQGVHQLRLALATVFAVPSEKVRVIHVPGAGCYGHNGADDVALEAALISRAVRQPVRVLWSRQEELSWAPLGSAMCIDIDARIDREGRISQWHQDVFSHAHLARPGWGDGVNLLSAQFLDPPFAPSEPQDPSQVPWGGGGDRNAIPYYDLKNRSVYYRLVPDSPFRTSALRSLGAFANVFAIESFMDELAIERGIDPIEFRLRHLTDKRAIEVLEGLARLSGWNGGGGSGDKGRGVGFSRYKNTGAYCGVVVDVELDNVVLVKRVFASVDAGLVINPDGVRNQIEGGIIQAISWTLKEEVSWDDEKITSSSWENYPILRFNEVPNIVTELIHRVEELSLGVGECAAGPVAAAIGNAVANAIGIRVRDLPLTADRIAAAIS